MLRLKAKNQHNTLTLFQHQQHNPMEQEHQENAFYFCLPEQQPIYLPLFCSYLTLFIDKIPNVHKFGKTWIALYQNVYNAFVT